MVIDVVVPSNRNIAELRAMVYELKRMDAIAGTSPNVIHYIPTGFPASASINRNFGMYQATGQIIIMIDDDIGGFYPGWHTDLVKPLIDGPDVRIVSARLLTPAGDLSPMMGCTYDLSKPVDFASPAILSAAIAFRRADVQDIKFDEAYIGSGFEDTDFCFQLRKKFGDEHCYFAVNNQCRLVHHHEMKNQAPHYQKNKLYFASKWSMQGFPGLV